LRDALRFGLHTSTAGALENAAIEAAEAGATAFQIFSSSPRMWRGSIPGQAEIKALQDRRKKHDLAPLAIHGNYLINLASADAEIRRKSIQAFRAEIARALLIGADYLVFHPGSFKDWTPEQALVAAGNGMAEAAHGLSGPLMLLIENTAGQGSSLGSKLEELAELRPGTIFRAGLSSTRWKQRSAGSEFRSCTPTTRRVRGDRESTVTSISAADRSANAASGSCCGSANCGERHSSWRHRRRIRATTVET
jgi:hypothetical protein